MELGRIVALKIPYQFARDVRTDARKVLQPEFYIDNGNRFREIFTISNVTRRFPSFG